MKKYIQFALISLFILGAFISCDNDAGSGILSNIVNSEEEATYNIKAVANDNNTFLYSVEDDGIYKTTNATPNVRSLVLNTSNYTNIENIYYNSNNDKLYFISNNTESTSKSLYYFDPDVSNPTPTEITINDTLISLSSNGYVLFKDDTNYYIEQISGVNQINTTTATNTNISITESLATIVPVRDDKLIIQTSSYNSSDEKYTFDYHLVDNSVIAKDIATDQDNKIISAVYDSTNYYCVLDNADLIKIDNTNTLIPYFDNDESTYSFTNLSANMHFENNDYLVLIDSSNYVLLYDLSDNISDSGFSVLSDGFANLLNNTSDVVFISKTSNSSPSYDFYIATNSNGYYSITIDDAAILDQDDSSNSSYSNSLL